MYVLGIETSCDETSCSVVKKRKVLSCVTRSSLPHHKKYGGVVPEIATRNHCKIIDAACALALKKAHISFKDIDVIGVTHRPGLVGALVVGLNFAKALSLSLKKPFIAVNHLYAHLFAPFLNTTVPIPFPFMGLVVSGGHTKLLLVKDFDNIRCIGSTLDDAAGEVLDKVGRAYGLGYPAGAHIDRLYQEAEKDTFPFKCGRKGFDFSFSGIKTALIYKKMELQKQKIFTQALKRKLLSSFQESIMRTIVENTLAASKRKRVNAIVCGGGVVANTRLRQLLTLQAKAAKKKLLLSPKNLTADNGAVVAGLAFYLYNKNRKPSRFEAAVFSN